MDRWAVELSKISGFLISDKGATDVFPNGLYEASKKDPPFTPYVVPKFQEKPWIAPLQSRERAIR